MFLLLAIVTIINTLVSAGFAVVGLIRPAAVLPSATNAPAERFFGQLAAARAIPLFLAAVAAAVIGNGTVLAWLGGISAVVQLADAGAGAMTGDRMKLYGPLTIAIVQIIALALYLSAGR